jgi:hypothetical protein
MAEPPNERMELTAPQLIRSAGPSCEVRGRAVWRESDDHPGVAG